MPVHVTTKYLGDFKRQKDLCRQIIIFMSEREGDWQVSILGSANSLNWEMTVTAPDGAKAVETMTPDQYQNLGYILACINRVVRRADEGMEHR
jgi:hypothetical protein